MEISTEVFSTPVAEPVSATLEEMVQEVLTQHQQDGVYPYIPTMTITDNGQRYTLSLVITPQVPPSSFILSPLDETP